MTEGIRPTTPPTGNAAAAGPRLLAVGAQGPDVATLQRRLAAAGVYAGAPDGKFGPQTDGAVRTFQTMHGLKPDGLVGPLTRAALLAAKPEPGARLQGDANAINLGNVRPAPGDPLLDYPLEGPAPKPSRPPVELPQPDMTQISRDDLTLHATDRYKAGDHSIDLSLPIEKGKYEVILDYPHDNKSKTGEGTLNHLYVYDRANDRVVARYVSNGGREGATAGHDLDIDRVVVRPTWVPTQHELAEDNYVADGPGPTGSMGLVKIHLSGAEYIHGVEDADLVDGVATEDAEAIDQLGQPKSHGCWNMSNPNAIELVERFGVGVSYDAQGKAHNSHTHVTILGNGQADRALSRHLEEKMEEEGLGDRLPSDGTDLLEKDYQSVHRYTRDHSYYDTSGVARPADKWYVDMWKARRKLEP